MNWITRASPRSPSRKISLTVAFAIMAALGSLALLSACNTGSDNDGAATTPAETATPAATATPTEPPRPANAGIYDDRIVFGQSAAFEGPAQALGIEMRSGIRTAFMEANAQGGVHGRQLELISLNDSYEPEAAIVNTEQLIYDERVFALIGAVGTPTSRSATPVTAEAGVPYVAPFTGAGFLRDPVWSNIVNLRASYGQETEEMVERLTTDLGVRRIAVLYQDDSFGLAGYTGVIAALERRNMEPVAIGVYPRNTTAIKAALIDIQQANPEGVIMIGAYQPVGSFISWAKFWGLDSVFMTVSFVGSNALAEELGPYGHGVFVTQVVPFPTDDSTPIVEAYLNALSAHSPETLPGFVSLEGYISGRLAIAMLERCGRDIDRECFLEILNSVSLMSLDEFPLTYGVADNQGSDAVFLSVIGPDGEYYPAETLLDVPQ